MSFRGTTNGGCATSGELLKDLGRQWIDCTREWRVLIEQEEYPDRAKFTSHLGLGAFSHTAPTPNPIPDLSPDLSVTWSPMTMRGPAVASAAEAILLFCPWPLSQPRLHVTASSIGSFRSTP
jgi:hypothetical protein